MKKSLIALAVMAAAGAASAQSSVQLYGIADVWVGSLKSESLVAGKLQGTRQTVVESGGVSDSRWGLKGSEDLGNGLKATFTLEQGFNIDSGAAAAGFNREASIGLQSNAFGTVKFGKQYNAFDDVSAAQSTVFDSDLAPINNVFYSTAFARSENNTIKYISPEFSGFTGSFSYSLGENKTAGADATDNYALAGQYANGPVAVGLGYAVDDTGAAGNDKATRLNGAYNFGAATLKASYGLVDYANNDEANEFEIGVDYPLASNLILSAGYANSEKENGAGAKFEEENGFGLAVAYVLSKRTTAYAGLTRATTEDGAGVDTNKTTIYAVGVKHTF